MLSARQEAFCVEFAKTANAAESYKRAGYTWKNENTANACASRLLKRDKIQARLAELREEVRAAAIADIAEVQEFWSAVMRGETVEEQVVVEGDGDGISSARTVEKAVSMKERLKASELLMKSRGGFDSSLTVNLAVPVIGGEESLED